MGDKNATSTTLRLSRDGMLVIFMLICFSLTLFNVFFSKCAASMPSTAVAPVNTVTKQTAESKRCPYPIVYNKPGKTGSTTILGAIRKWTKETGRPLYYCGNTVRITTLTLNGCLPEDHSGCAVVAMHIELDQWTMNFLEEKIGKFMLVTSLRSPEERLMSSIMQNLKITYKEAPQRMSEIRSELAARTGWAVYNYHTGSTRTGSCPVTGHDEKILLQLVRRYDVIIDLEYLEQSNAILKWKGLFQIPEGIRKNVRGASKIQLDQEGRRVLKSKTCIEEQLYKLFRMRMGYLYGLATDTDCLIPAGRYPKPCF